MFTFAVNFGFHHRIEVMGLKGNPVKTIQNFGWCIPELFPQL